MSSASPMRDRMPPDAQTLMRAVDAGDAACVKLLLAEGASANAAAEDGETALMRASAKGNLEIVEALLDAGGDVHAKSENGFTPLFMAVFFGHVEIARALLDRGSDPSAPTRASTTALKWARTWGSAEIVKLLDEAGATRASESASENENVAFNIQKGSPPVFFPTDGDIRPVVPLSEVGDAQRRSNTTPLANKPFGVELASRKSVRAEVVGPVQIEQGDELDETTHVPARRRRVVTQSANPLGGPTRAKRSWAMPLAALALSMVVGLIAGAYLIKSRRPVAIQQPSPQSPQPDIANVTASATTDIIEPDVTTEKADASEETVKREEAASKPPLADAARLRSPIAEPLAHRINIQEARPERRDNASAKSVGRLTAGRPVEKEAAATSSRSAESASRAPQPKHPLPITSPPPSTESKKVIQWP